MRGEKFIDRNLDHHDPYYSLFPRNREIRKVRGNMASPRITIMLVYANNMELYEGTIIDRDDNVLYTVRRWSESAVRTSLMRYLYTARMSLEGTVQVEIDSSASEQLELTRKNGKVQVERG